MIAFLRKNIGTITAFIGILLLVILTYGDLGELFTDKYWAAVGGNITSIGALAIGLALTQFSIKQGVGEQALQSGLNKQTFNEQGILQESCTPARYSEHQRLLKLYRERDIYLAHYLIVHNRVETARKKAEFLVENDFTSEEALFAFKPKWYQFKAKHYVQKYRSIRVNITCDSLKWSTTEIVRDKFGRIQKLEQYRARRAARGLIMSALSMIGMTFIAGGLFLDIANIPWWQKTIKFATYIISIALTVILVVVRNYEKGAFGVANELGEINGIWYEFGKWTPNAAVIKAVTDLRGSITTEEIKNEKEPAGSNGGTNLQVQQKESQAVQNINTGGTVAIPWSSSAVYSVSVQPISEQPFRDQQHVGQRPSSENAPGEQGIDRTADGKLQTSNRQIW